MPEEEQISEKAMGWTIGVALVVLHRASSSCCPRSRRNGLGDVLGLDGFWFHVAEGALRLGDLPRLPAR